MATQRTKIYLEGVALDLDKNIDIDLTYSIADIADFEKRTTSFSKTVSIPGTAHNNFIFGNYFDFNIQNGYDILETNVGVNFNPFKKAFVKVTVDNVEVFAGVLRLLEITSIDGVLTYQCALFGSLGGLFSTIGEKLLTDLSLSDLNHTYNWTNIKNSWTIGAGGHWVYPMSNYGININTGETEYDVKNFRPAIKVKTLFDRIINEAGYSYNSDFWFSNNLNKLVLLNNEEQFSIFVDEFGSLPINEFTASGIGAAGEYQETDLLFSTGASPFTYLSLVTLPGDLWRLFNNGTADVNVKLNLAFDFVSTLKDVAEPISIRVKIYENSISPTLKDTIDLSLPDGITTPTGDLISGSLSASYNFQLKQNYFAEFYFVNRAFPLPTGGGEITVSNMTMNFVPVDLQVKVPASYNNTITGKSIVPTDVKQSDFLKSVINMLNLYIIQDKDDEFNLTFLPYPDFYSEDYVDWTEKKDIAKGFSIKSSNDFVPRNYLLNYKDDNDYYSKLYRNKYGISYGNAKIVSENEFSKDDKKTELIFSICPLISSVNHDRILSAMYDVNPDGSYKQLKLNPKIAFFFGSIPCESYSVKNGASTIATETAYGYAGHIYDPTNESKGTLWDTCFTIPSEIYFNISTYPTQNLLSKYYQAFIDSQNNKDTKLVTLYFLLNTIDIMNIDFRKLVKMDNGIYYLNKIDGYNPLGNELTKVELLRIA